jgi:DNA-binding MarR family transcriptional regulator
MSAQRTKSAGQPNQEEQTYLLKYLVALELLRHGLRQTEIAKRLHLQTSTLNSMLKGLGKKGKGNEK